MAFFINTQSSIDLSWPHQPLTTPNVISRVPNLNLAMTITEEACGGPCSGHGQSQHKGLRCIMGAGDVKGKSTTTLDEHTEYTGVYFLKKGPARCLLSLTEGKGCPDGVYVAFRPGANANTSPRSGQINCFYLGCFYLGSLLPTGPNNPRWDKQAHTRSGYVSSLRLCLPLCWGRLVHVRARSRGSGE